MRVPTLFVTATDTGVGKTAVGSALAAVLRARGRNVGVMKPVASGCASVGGELVSADAVCMARAAGVNDPMELVCPIRLEAPLAPMAAADIEVVALDLGMIWRAAEELAARHDCLVVEGIGGIMVPVTRGCLVADVAVRMGASVLVVARSGLGTINHTLLTVGYARSRGLKVAGVLLNSSVVSGQWSAVSVQDPHPALSLEGRGGGLAERTNPGVLRGLCGAPVLGPLGYDEGVSVETGRLGDLPGRLAELDGVEELLAGWLSGYPTTTTRTRLRQGYGGQATTRTIGRTPRME